MYELRVFLGLSAGYLRDPGVDSHLRGPVALAALAALGVASAVLVAAAAAEVLRAAGRAGRLVSLLDRLTPRPVRRVAAVAVASAVLMTGPAASVAAGRTPRSGGLGGGSGDPPVVADRRSLDRRTTTRDLNPTSPAGGVRDGRAHPTDLHPSGDDARGAEPASPPEPGPVGDGEEYVVVPGDCLWAIAARRLGPSATNSAVDSAWREIYARNRTAVGDDPDLVHPGLVLTLPPLAQPS